MTLKLDDERIIYLYVNEEKSLEAVGKIVGCSPTTVKNRLQAAGIAIRNRGGARLHLSFAKTYRDRYDVPGIVHAYCEELKSAQTIAKEFGTTAPTIRRILDAEGIPLRSISEAIHLKHQQRRENRRAPEPMPPTPPSEKITRSLEAGLPDVTVNASDSVQEMRDAGLRIDQIADIKEITAKEVYAIIYP